MQLKGQRGPRLSSETERQKSKQRTNMLLVSVALYSTLDQGIKYSIEASSIDTGMETNC